MGNVNVGKILPVFDTLLLLVMTLFGTAGLLRSVESTGRGGQGSSAAFSQLAAEVGAKQKEVEELEKERKTQGTCGDLGLDTLRTLLQNAGRKQENLAEMQAIITDVHGKLEGAKTIVQDKHNSVALEDTIKALRTQIEQLERRKHDIENGITQEDHQRAEIQELQRELEAIQSEIQKLKALIAKHVQKPDDPTPPGGRPGLFRNYYRGPFLLLECDDKGVVVYPGNKRIAVDNSVAEFDWLKDQVRSTGAAQLLVRPSGFKDSYRKFYELLTELADKEESAGKKIVLNFWPIEANESIQEYLPERS